MNEEDIFETNIIMTLTENYYNSYYDKIIIKEEIPLYFNGLKQETKKVKILKNVKDKIIGSVFLLDNYRDSESDLDEKQNNEEEEKN